MLFRLVTRLFGCLAVLALLLASPLARAQSWSAIPISFYPGTMILMTDGTVLVHYVDEVGSTTYPSEIWSGANVEPTERAHAPSAKAPAAPRGGQ